MLIMKHFLLFLLTFVLFGQLSAGTMKKPDFAFPKTVSGDAESMFRKAQKNHDGDAMVAALAQWCLAESMIAPEKIDTILARVHFVREAESRTDIKALLYLMEISFQKSRYMNLQPLYHEVLSLGKEALVQFHVENYPLSIDQGDAAGRRCLPSLFDLIKQSQVDYCGVSYHYKEFWDDWQSEYAQAFRLTKLTIRGDNRHLVDSFLVAHPNAPLKGQLLDKIHHLERKQCDLFSRVLSFHSQQSVFFQANVYNMPEVVISIRDRWTHREVQRKTFQVNYPKPYESVDTTFIMDPLPYGRYYPIAFAPEDESSQTLKKRSLNYLDNHSFSVSDLYPITASWQCGEMPADLRAKTERIVVDRWTGSPVLDAQIFEDVRNSWRPVRGADSCCSYLGSGDARFFSPNSNLHGRFYTSLGVYRPGENLQWSLLVWHESVDTHGVAADEPLLVILNDARGNLVDSLSVVTDSMGTAMGAFMLPKGENVPLGSYRLTAKTRQSGSLAKSIYTITNKYIEVSEYKVPTFTIAFDKHYEQLKSTDTAIVRLKVSTMSGMPLAEQEVDIREAYYGVLDTTLQTDREGCITLRLTQHDLLDETTETEGQRSRYRDFLFIAEATDAGGETHECRQNLLFLDESVQEPTMQTEEELHEDEALWIPKDMKSIYCDDVAVFQFRVNVPDAHVYYMATSRSGMVKQGWLNFREAGLQTLKFQMPKEGTEPMLKLNLYCVYHGVVYEADASAMLRQPKLIVKTEVMRDRLVPGSTETWRLKAEYEGEKTQSARVRMMLLLYNASLKSLANNRWSMSAGYQYCNPGYVAFPSSWNRALFQYYWKQSSSEKGKLTLPQLQLWGERFGVLSRNTGTRLFFAKAAAVTLVEDDVELEDNMEVEEEAVVGHRSDALLEMAVVAQKGEAPDTELKYPVALRDSMTKVALFEPTLQTDQNGVVEVTFPVPLDNTTWLLEALAFDRSLKSVELHQEIVAQRPVMVQPALPRFLRQGDETVLGGRVQNASDAPVEAYVKVEVMDRRTMNILAQTEQKLVLGPNRQEMVGVPYQVADTLIEVAFRITAIAEGCSDAEQVKLPVLPAVEPVVDSYPFFRMDMALSDTVAVKDSLWRVAGSPERYDWQVQKDVKGFCLDNLKRVYNEESVTATDLAHSIFAQSLCNVLADSSVNLDKVVGKLAALQNVDGGFSWIDYEHRESSAYVTGVVLELMGEARRAGAEVPEKLNLKSALQYLEGEMLKDSYGMKGKSLRQWRKMQQSYLYLRSMYPEAEYASQDSARTRMMRVQKAALRYAGRHWRSMDLMGRGYAVRSLSRLGQGTKAMDIARSIDEHLEFDEYYGAYWSLYHVRRDFWRLGCCLWFRPLQFSDQLALNSHLLQSLEEVGCEQNLSKVRQWMLMNKRTTDWGNSSLVADAMYALLEEGKSGSLVQTSPMWGALTVTHSVPVREVQAHRVKEVSVDSVLLLDAATRQSVDSFGVGDKVLIKVSLSATQSMDYVTIRVPRPAGLEPKRQLSGHFWQDNLYGFYETRDVETRFYVQNLTAGRHTLYIECYASQTGTFALPATTLTCEYEPTFTVHSGASVMEVR